MSKLRELKVLLMCQFHPGREKENPVTSGNRNGKSSYVREEKWEIQLHPGREMGNPVTSGDRKGNPVTSGWGEKREIQLKRISRERFE